MNSTAITASRTPAGHTRRVGSNGDCENWCLTHRTACAFQSDITFLPC
ncbi:hypothetical protein ACFY30_19150 [Streptomyces sp. NPDC000345]